MKKEKGLERFLLFHKLPKDITIEILLRLDIKSLGCCECVCKSWKTLIRKTSFVNHRLKYQPSSVILFQSSSRLGYEYRLSRCFKSFYKIQQYDNVRVPSWLSPEGSDNGVLCFSDSLSNVIRLCNPATTEWKVLPYPPKCPWENSVYRLGLGFDSLRNDFKVVRVCAEDINDGKYLINLFKNDNKVSIYSLRRNSWKQKKMPNIFLSSSSDSSCIVRTILDHHCSAVVNGSIHWMLSFIRDSDEDVDSSTPSKGIVAFDLRTEDFKLINPPQVEYQAYFRLGKFSKYLSLFATPVMDQVTVFEIWAMKEYSVFDSWVKQVKVDLDEFPLELSFPRPLVAFGNNGNVLFQSDFSLYRYDLESRKLEFIGTGESHSLTFSTTYVESNIHI